MSNSIKNLLIFVSGVGVGAFVSWRILEERYERIAQEEIDSVKEVYSYKKTEEPNLEGFRTTPKPSLEELKARLDLAVEAEANYEKENGDYSGMVANLGYTSGKEGGEDMKSFTASGQEANDKPYVISPDEFGELGDYETVSLTYYKDGVVTDTFDEPLDDVDEIIGYDSLNHFGEYEDDSVFVRNDALKSDYEILLDERNYADVMANYSEPHPEDE